MVTVCVALGIAHSSGDSVALGIVHSGGDSLALGIVHSSGDSPCSVKYSSFFPSLKGSQFQYLSLSQN